MRTIVLRNLGWSVLALILLQAPAAWAQVFYLSSTGDDGSLFCNREAPCNTLNAVVAKVSSGAMITILDAMTVNGTISKSVKVVADGITVHVPSLTVNLPPAGVVNLKGLTLEGSGLGDGGLNIVRAGAVHIQDCVIRGYTNGALARGVHMVPTQAAELFMTNCQIANNRTGLLIAPSGAGSARVTLNNVRLENNHTGLKAAGPANVTVANSVVAGNSSTGLFVTGANTTLRLGNSVVSDNGTGLLRKSGAQLISYGNNLIGGNSTNGAPSATLPLQ